MASRDRGAMSKTQQSAAKWAVEVEWNDGLIEYFSTNDISLEEDFVRLVIVGGGVIEVERDDIRKVMIMRTKE